MDLESLLRWPSAFSSTIVKLWTITYELVSIHASSTRESSCNESSTQGARSPPSFMLCPPMGRNRSCWTSALRAPAGPCLFRQRVLSRCLLVPASVFFLASPRIGFLPAQHCLVSLKASCGSGERSLDQKWTLEGTKWQIVGGLGKPLEEAVRTVSLPTRRSHSVD